MFKEFKNKKFIFKIKIRKEYYKKFGFLVSLTNCFNKVPLKIFQLSSFSIKRVLFVLWYVSKNPNQTTTVRLKVRG